jgi:hypothetical protein
MRDRSKPRDSVSLVILFEIVLANESPVFCWKHILNGVYGQSRIRVRPRSQSNDGGASVRDGCWLVEQQWMYESCVCAFSNMEHFISCRRKCRVR